MPSITLTAPDGKKITLTPPSGATPQEIQSVVDSVIAQHTPAKQAATPEVSAPEAPSLLSRLSGAASTVMRAGDIPRQGVLDLLAGYSPGRAIEQVTDPSKVVTAPEIFKKRAPEFPGQHPIAATALGTAMELADPLLLLGIGKRGVAEAVPGIEKGIEVAGATAKAVPTIEQSLKALSTAEKTRDAYVAAKATGQIKGAADDLKKLLAPETRGPEAKLAHEVVGEHAAKLAAKDTQLKNQFRVAGKVFDWLPDEKRLDFISKVETPTLGSHDTPEMQKIGGALRTLLDERHAKISAMRGGNIGFIENYFPHIWEDPEGVRNRILQTMGKSPLAGPKSFLKQRKIPTTAEGLQLGFKPVTTNPVDLTLLKVHEMDRYIMAQELAEEAKKSGLMKFARSGKSAPAGMRPINDPIAVVKQFSEEEGGFIERGRYYASDPVATIFERYLGPGLRNSKLYQIAYAPVTPINQARLSLSAFHLTLETINDLAVNTGMALRDVAGGAIKGDLGRMLKGSARAAKTATGIQLWEDLVRGHRAMKALSTTPLGGADIVGEVGQVIKAGGRFAEDNLFARRLTANFADAVAARKPLQAGWAGLKILPEMLSVPIMKGFVPRVKLGAFLQLAEHNLERMKPQTAQEARAILNSSWDHVDNVFGQLTRDNLFLSKKTKDVLDMVISFPGWNIGSARLMAGLVRAPYQALRAATGKATTLETQMATSYALGLTTVVATMGALLQYTWTGQWPQTVKDYFYPRTGRTLANGMQERKQLPSYIRDAVGMASHPFETVKHKENPLLSTASELVSNMDFYGREIRDPEAPVSTQIGQSLEHFSKLPVPFSVQNLLRGGGPKSAGEAFENVIGLNPPPKAITNTPAMNVLDDIMRRHGIRGPIKQEEEAAYQAKRGIVEMLRQGQTGATAGLPGREAKILERRGAMTPMQDKFNRIGIKDAFKVYAVADEKERDQLTEMLRQKLSRAMRDVNPDEQVKLQQRFDDLTRTRGPMPLKAPE